MFDAKIKNKNPKILFEIHHGLGDVIQALPVLVSIKKKYSQAYLGVIVSSDVHKEIIKLDGYADIVYTFSLNRKKEILSLIRNSRKVKWDIGLVSPLTNKKLGPHFLKLIGCKKVVYMSDKKSRIIGGIQCMETSDHKIIQLKELLSCIDVPMDDYVPHLSLDAFMVEYAQRTLSELPTKRYILAFCIGTNPVVQKIGKGNKIEYDIKKWGVSNYLDLANRLGNKCLILFIGGHKEYEEIKITCPELLKSDSCFVNKTTIKETMALLSCCDLVIGGDTGMIHAADALNVPTIVIYGPTNPSLVGPLSGKSTPITLNYSCQYCYDEPERLYNCKNNNCIKDITVDQVEREIKNCLRRAL